MSSITYACGICKQYVSVSVCVYVSCVCVYVFVYEAITCVQSFSVDLCQHTARGVRGVSIQSDEGKFILLKLAL